MHMKHASKHRYDFKKEDCKEQDLERKSGMFDKLENVLMPLAVKLEAEQNFDRSA